MKINNLLSSISFGKDDTEGIIKTLDRSNRSEVFSRKDVLKICRKFTEEHPC